MPQITRILPMVCAIALLHIPGIALECCFDDRPPCQAYWASDAVFIGEAKDIEIAMEKTSDGKELRENVRVIFSVTEAFRGVSSTEIKVSTNNSECGFRFETGGLYFVYASIDRNGSGGLTTSSCTRTQEYSESSPDLIYARSLTKAAPGAAIFGRVTQRIEGMNNGQGSTSAPLPNVRVIIEGQEKKFNPKTDEEGRYSMSGLTPGDYTVKIDLPEWLDAGKEQKVQVYERGCAKVDFEGRWDGKLSGTVIDAEGRPVKGVGVYLVKAEKLGMDWMISSESNDDGNYELSGIQPGRYRVIFLYIGLNPLQGDPQTKFYHPGVSDPDQAFIFSFGEGQRIRDFALRLPPLPKQKTIEGVVLRTEGKPLPGVLVCYGQPNANRVDRVKSDEQGKFSFKAYEGVKYYVTVVIPKGNEEYDYFRWMELNDGSENTPVKIIIDPNRPESSHKFK
jgi:hypothetical protein